MFYSPTDYKMYLSLIREQLADAQCRVLAYCLMTNHVHLVVVPERDDSLAVLFRRAHGRYSQYLNTRRHRTGHLWQQRYFSCPLADSHHWAALRYLEQNPCRACMVKAPAEYRWSSAAAHLGQGPGQGKDRSGLLDMAFWEKSRRRRHMERNARSGDGAGSGSAVAAMHLRRPAVRRRGVCESAGAAFLTVLEALGL